MNSQYPKIKNYLYKLKSYPVGESQIPGHKVVINLASNENSMPVSATVLEALKTALLQANRYPNHACENVIYELSQFYGIPAQNLVCGNGSGELIFLLAEAFVSCGDEVLIWKHGFFLYETAAFRVGASVVRAQSEGFLNIDALLNAVTKSTKLVFIDNPNNPSGAYITAEELRKIRKELRSDILLVIDAAYAEYVTDSNYIDGSSLVEEFGNVCMLRTFSKIYGLAGARLGWLYGSPEIINAIRVLQQPASVSSAAQYAAVAALQETERVTFLREQNRILRDDFQQAALNFRVKAYPTQANFILVDFFSESIAQKIFSEFKNHGIIVRPMAAYNLKSCLRITIGSPDEMKALKTVLPSVMSRVVEIKST